MDTLKNFSIGLFWLIIGFTFMVLRGIIKLCEFIGEQSTTLYDEHPIIAIFSSIE